MVQPGHLFFFPSSRGQKSRSSPHLWRVVQGCTVTSPPCSICTVLPSPPSTRWVWGRWAIFPRVSGYYMCVWCAGVCVRVCVCTPGWASRDSRALNLRLGHLGWGTGVHGEGSNCPSLGVDWACLRPWQCLRGLRKDSESETGAGPYVNQKGREEES